MYNLGINNIELHLEHQVKRQQTATQLAQLAEYRDNFRSKLETIRSQL